MRSDIRWLSFVFAVAVLVAGGRGRALAQDAFGEDGGDAAGDPAAPAVSAPEDAGKWSRWSQRFIDRPRTLPMGMIEAGGYLDINRTVVATTTGTTSDTALGLSVGGGYGVSDRLEVRGSYGLTLADFEAKGPLALGAGFGFAEGTLAIAGSADFVYDLGVELGEIGLGARVRYLLKPDLSLFTARQLAIGVIGDVKPATLRLPIGVGYQVNDRLYAFGETELAVLNLKDSQSLALFADYVPITLGGVFALSSKLEVGGLLFTDLKNDPFDALFLEFFGRLYL
ncbi:MAG: hypothetical protein R3B48_12335 [Kofleriaceae bacterium]